MTKTADDDDDNDAFVDARPLGSLWARAWESGEIDIDRPSCADRLRQKKLRSTRLTRKKMKLILFLTTLVHAHAFFDFLKSSTPASSTIVDVPGDLVKEYDHFRGIPSHLKEKYQQETYTCDNGQRKISSSSINDGYCDCADHSDEPGTSACTRGTFHCINKGYKPIAIPSSRVDDGVCDCCDGSDEGIYKKCADTCKEMAELEFAAQNRLLNTYKIGNQLQQLWADSARAQLEQEANQVPDPTTAQNIRNEISSLDSAISAKETELNELNAQVEKDMKVKIFKLLKLSNDKDGYSYAANFLSTLIKVLHFDEVQLTNYLSDHPAPAHENNDEHYEDDYSISNDEKTPKDSTEAASTTSTGSTECDLVAITGNSHLQAICEAHPDFSPHEKSQLLLSTIFSVIKDYRAYYESMLILGYYRLHQSYENLDVHVSSHITTQGQDACPIEFEKISNSGLNHCEMKELLKDFYSHLSFNQGKETIENSMRTLKDQRDSFQTTLRSLENNENLSTKAKENLETYLNYYQFYYLKGQCFEANDGKFSYSVCMLENVKQKEIGGYNNVLLGDYQSIQEISSKEYGIAYQMKFHNGQHCHAFGARSAEVTVICGEKNVLKSAQEPSTCFYTLILESPAACTENFAKANGLSDKLM